MRRVPAGARIVVSGGILLGLALVLDPGDVADRILELRGEWVALALVLSVVQVVVSAGRWKFTAARLGIALPWSAAIGEYYLATFLNQILPGGVMGDVSRAWRHGRTPETDPGPVSTDSEPVVVAASRDPGLVAAGTDAAGVTPATDRDPPRGDFRVRAAHAVILERASGQLVMTIVALGSLAILATRLDGPARLWWLGGALATALVGGLLARAVLARLARMPVAGRLLADARRGLIAGPAAALQLSTSLVVVATYLATWIVATRAIGIDTPTVTLLPLVAPVLVTMLVPVTVAGWGLREAGAAALWALAGLTAADGVAISVAYGLLVLLGSLPGGIALLAALIGRRGRGRREGRHPA